MKKNYTLLSLILISSIGFAQSIKNKIDLKGIPTADHALTAESEGLDEIKKNNPFDLKTFGDTMFYDDFDDAKALQWTITNENSSINNFAWKRTRTYDDGQFSRNAGNIQSTTAANGFMELPADNYNTPVPAPGAEPMNTYFTSQKIRIDSSKSVLVSYQQYLRFCCNIGNELVLEASTDSLSWVTFDATAGLQVNQANADGVANNVVNISEVAADDTTVYLRFRSTDNSHYFWMIDDVTIIEGPKNDLILSNPTMEFNGLNYSFNPFYNQIPYDLFSPVPFTATGTNNGYEAAIDARLEVDVTHVTDLNGNAGNGLVYSDYNLTNTATGDLDPFPASALYIVDNFPFVPLQNGDFQVDFNLTSDSIDLSPGDESATQLFTTTDSVFARDDNGFGGGTGPASYLTNNVLGGNDFDAFATLYIVESRTNDTVVPTSITFYVSADEDNIGVDIIPTVWTFDESQLPDLNAAWNHTAANSIVADGDLYSVVAADTNSFITLPISPDTRNGIFGLDSGQYMVGWETIGGGKPNGDKYFEVANDVTTSLTQPFGTTVAYHNHSGARFGVAVQPVIRLNVGKVPVQTGLEDTKAVKNQIFDVIPNPNKGQFKINIAAEGQTTYNLSIRNMLGQTVYSDVLNVNNALTERVNIESFDKGIYFVVLENDTERLEKKVVLN